MAAFLNSATLSRRSLAVLFGMGGLGALSACQSDSRPRGVEEPLETIAPEAESLSPPDAKLHQAQAQGTVVEPVSGLRFVVPDGVKALTPERLGEGRVSVTFVWEDPEAWGYLVAEGPASFPAADTDAETAAHQDQQELIAAGVKASVPQKIEWAGYTQAVVLAWNQWTLPPGWPNSTSIDAIQLLLVNEAGASYRVMACGGRDTLRPRNPAWDALCSVGAEALAASASPSPSPSPSPSVEASPATPAPEPGDQ